MEYKDLLKYSKLEILGAIELYSKGDKLLPIKLARVIEACKLEKILSELIEAEKLEQKALQDALGIKARLIEKYGEDYTRACTKEEDIEHCDKLLSYNSFLRDVKVILERYKKQTCRLKKIIALHEQVEKGVNNND